MRMAKELVEEEEDGEDEEEEEEEEEDEEAKKKKWFVGARGHEQRGKQEEAKRAGMRSRQVEKRHSRSL